MNDGIIAQDVNVFSSEVRIPVEVWKDDKMLFPTYDESVPGRNLLRNSTFNQGREFWPQIPYLTVIPPNSDKPRSSILVIERTQVGDQQLSNVQFNTERIYMEPQVGDSITFAFDYFCENYELNSPINLLNFRRSDSPVEGTLTNVLTRNVSNLGLDNLEVDGKWVRVEETYTFNSTHAVPAWFIFGLYISNTQKGRTVRYKVREITVTLTDVAPRVWYPHPFEILLNATVHPVNCSYRIENNEIVLSNFTENRGYVDIEVSYGEGWTRTKRVNFHRKNRIQDIQVKGKRPYRAYLGNNLIWHKYHERTQAIFDYANDRYFQLPTNRIAYDDYLRGLIKNGLLDKLDLHYIFSGDGDTNFKLINVVNPGTYNGTAFGGLEWSNEGVKGNGVNGYVDTNFNPALLVEGQRYQLNDASRSAVVFSTTNNLNTGRIDSDTISNITFACANTARQRISSSQMVASANMSNPGNKVIIRVGLNVTLISKDKTIREEEITDMGFSNHTIFVLGTLVSVFPETGIASYHLGASLTYEETQQFRQLFNKYLKSNNLQEIA